MAKLERLEVVPSKAASQFLKLPMVVRDIVRLCDGRRTVEAICACSPLDAGGTVDVLRRLSELGVVANRGRSRVRRDATPTVPTPRVSAWLEGERLSAPEPAPVRRAKPGRPAAKVLPAAAPVVVTIDLVARDFSADEERFFASTIDHLIED